MKTVYPDTRFFVIGNADEQQALAETIRDHDIVIRCNNPNASCPLAADWLFMANGYTQCRKLHITSQHLFKDNMHIFFRYNLKDIMRSRHQLTSYSKRLKYLFRFPAFKKRYGLNRFSQSVIPSELYEHCTRIIQHRQPSTGLLALYYVMFYHPEHEVFVHNFTNEGWVGHDWDGERKLMAVLIAEGKIKAV